MYQREAPSVLKALLQCRGLLLFVQLLAFFLIKYRMPLLEIIQPVSKIIIKGVFIMEEIKVEEVKTKYAAYLLPALCFVVGILIGFLLSPMKNGKIAVLANNRRRVPDDMQGFGIRRRDDVELAILLDHSSQICHLPVDLPCARHARESLADILCDIGGA